MVNIEDLDEGYLWYLKIFAGEPGEPDMSVSFRDVQRALQMSESADWFMRRLAGGQRRVKVSELLPHLLSDSERVRKAVFNVLCHKCMRPEGLGRRRRYRYNDYIR